MIFLVSLPACLIQVLKSIAEKITTPKWYLPGFIACSAGLWPLGLYLWEKPAARWWLRIPLRLLSYICFFAGSIFCIAGLWQFVWIFLLTRIFIWGYQYFQLEQPADAKTFDYCSLIFIGIIFLVLAISKERLIDLMDPSDHYYHMAVAQKILERGEIPLWDDWEFAPVGRPHLYPPVIHLLIAFFSGSPDNVAAGFSTVQMLLLPAALWGNWFVFRRLWGSTLAFLALLVLSMEFPFVFSCLLGLPSSLVNAFFPFILLAFIEKRIVAASVLLGLAYYTHTGLPVLISLGLLVFGFWKREYFLNSIIVVLCAALLSLPWTIRYWFFQDWMHSAGPKNFDVAGILSGILTLQFVNPIFWMLTVMGWFKCKNKDAALFKSLIAGFLPMLFQYGGRFVMHGAPLWAPLIAWNFKGFLEQGATRRRAVGFMLCTLLPLPCLSYMMDKPVLTKPKPFFSITASHYSLILAVNRAKKDYSDLENLIQTIRNTTAPDTIIHLPDGVNHFGDLLVVRTGRVTDMGGWAEVFTPSLWKSIENSRKTPVGCIFVCRFRENIPAGYDVKPVGTYFIGYPKIESGRCNE